MQLEDLLTDEQKLIRESVRKFVEKEIMPIREQLEEDYSRVEGILQKLVDLGFQKKTLLDYMLEIVLSSQDLIY